MWVQLYSNYCLKFSTYKSKKIVVLFTYNYLYVFSNLNFDYELPWIYKLLVLLFMLITCIRLYKVYSWNDISVRVKLNKSHDWSMFLPDWLLLPLCKSFAGLYLPTLMSAIQQYISMPFLKVKKLLAHFCHLLFLNVIC